ncbi:hypothetical protein BDV93DRAFT_562620 [Ceratobasidium sp. AG-I]|nr:hypothetical protein BDV93DRAFT_562620 [Ceratobasidium sp. AG-I]
MSSTPSRIASNWSLGVLMGSNSLAAIRFPLGWNSKVGPVFVWYEQLSCTKFVSIQHRKEHEAPFHHEFLCAKLNDGNLCRFERFGDPDARTDALTEQGSAAHNLAEILPANQLATFDTTSDLLEEIRFPQEIDIMDVLEICYNIQQDKQTRTYTLQRYNCYFFCWCVLLLLTRKLALWEKTLLGIWDRTIQQLESDLFKAAPTDQDSLVFLLCRWLAPNTSRPEGFVIRALCDELSRSRASTLKRLCAQLELTLWEYDWQGAIQGELSNAEKIAGWAERQAPISAVPNLMQDSAESHYEGTGIQSSASRKSRFGWMRKAMDMVKNMSGDAAVDDAHAHPSGTYFSPAEVLYS